MEQNEALFEGFYDTEYIHLQNELVNLQEWVVNNNEKVIILFEGRDTAGKGGAIMRFVRFLNPRHMRIVALNKPTEIEKNQWYFQRYIEQLPRPGEIVFFDRSWYNRAVVEPVMGFCSEIEYNHFMNQVNWLEDTWISEGYRIVKFWFSIASDEQQRRINERQTNPLIRWKLSSVDLQAQMKWDLYSEYKQKMFQSTSTPRSPWVIVDGNNKEVGRREAMRYLMDIIPYENKGLYVERISPDPRIIRKFIKTDRFQP